ncbi:hypothetical protein SLS54_009045 [Diplodia seriata]
MAEDEKAAESVGSRRGQKNLPPLQTQLDSAQVPHSSRWRRSRAVVPPPPEHKVAPPPPQPVPDPPAKLENRKSTMSLFSLFNRPRVERARGHHEIGLPTIPDVAEAKPTTALSAVTATPQSASGKPADQRAMTPKSRGSSFNRKSRTGGSSNWEPPPLFQAYPQALKHAMLPAPNASAEAIISTQAHKRQYSILKENLQSKLDLSNGGDEASPTTEKLQKREKRMSTSSTLAAPDMTHKIYVLSTSGYLLQYSGEGPSERMPEKILQLGRDSAAFACDLIPGKHWVLQISQSTTDDGTVTAQQPRSLLSRFRMQGAAAKRTAAILLLVFDTPEEMGEWLTAIRQEIDVLAGRKTRSDVDQENSQENGAPKLTKMPSHRYYVQRDPSRFDGERSPMTSPVGSPAQTSMDWPSATMRRNASDAASTTSRFTFKRRSVEGSSMATTSYDGSQLNQLREDSRLSMASNRTSGTSPATSTGPPSPVRDSTPLPADEAQRSPTTLKSFSMSPSTSSRRRSMPMNPLSPTDEDQAQKSQRHSTFGVAPAGARQSPVPPSEDGHKSPTPDGSAPRTIKNRMSFSRPFNLHTSHGYTPMPTIRSASAPPEKMTMPAGQAVSTDTAESARPPSTIGSLPSTANSNSNPTQRQTPPPNPGFRPIPLFDSANFTLAILPARLAHRIQSLRNLPYIVVSNPHVSKIHGNYLHSLSTLLPWAEKRVESLEDEIRFTEVMADLVHTHANTISILARGFLEARRYISPQEVTRFLDEHLRARIGTRLIAEQHIALHMSSQPHNELCQDDEKGQSNASSDGEPKSSFIGVIDTELRPADIVRHCENMVSEICELKYGVRPRIVITGEPDYAFAHIPMHLEYIITELLKNAFRATVERGMEREPIEVTIAPLPETPVPSSPPPPTPAPPAAANPAPHGGEDAADAAITNEDQGNADRASKTEPMLQKEAQTPARRRAATANIRPLERSTPGVTIRIRDRGGGISPANYSRIWEYSFTTFNEDDARASLHGGGGGGGGHPLDALSAISGPGGDAGNPTGSSLAGLGYGLPLGRAYAEYFGGGIAVQSLWGWGTDVYLSLRGVGKVD